ncbi:MAG TPA: DUF2786 domain-containing protein [Candidatus Methanomethylophilaceae archaeon]|nr:DUF2786 domain-containing protein [Candidatus Methanomethylophilaceae archaeon]
MKREDTIRKIVACLNLGSSPNLNEAETAILMARTLMAKYKISEKELASVRLYEDEVVTKTTSIHMTNGRKYWIGILAKVISEGFGCDIYSVQRKPRSRNREIVIVGEKYDAEVANEVFRSAYLACNNNILSLGQSSGRLSRDRELSYGTGFAHGVKSAISQQDEDNTGYALVMSTPQNVVDYMHGLNIGKSTRTSACIDNNLQKKGYADGVAHLRKQLESTEAA